MKTQRRTAEKQYRLIMECRSNGPSDYQWRTEHDINPGTFYNWVKRKNLDTIPALDMHRHVLLYVNQGLEAHQRAFSPNIIIEDQYLQTFVHTLCFYKNIG